jgi:hypothetical protein
MPQVRSCASEEFCRLVWNHFDKDHPLEFDHDPLPHLYAPLSGVRWLPGDKAELHLGNDRLGARVDLVRERGKYRLDDVVLISGPSLDQRVRLRHSIHMRLARNR